MKRFKLYNIELSDFQISWILDALYNEAEYKKGVPSCEKVVLNLNKLRTLLISKLEKQKERDDLCG